LTIRSAEIAPHLAGSRFGGAWLEGYTLNANWLLGNGTRLSVLANLSADEQAYSEYDDAARPIFGGAIPASLAPYAVHWTIGDA
jgi:maltooligosyltrehalose trehalohydrolase